MVSSFNPCCGVKLKTALISIAVVDIVYGSIFLALGVWFFLSDETPRLLKRKFELINLLVRPGLKIVVGIILYLSAKLHMKKNGIMSIIGCATWIAGDIFLLVLMILRLNEYRSNRRFMRMIQKSGATTLESFAMLDSVFPFLTVGILCYEFVCVLFFIVKICNDRKILKATALSLKAAQEEAQKNSQSSGPVEHSMKTTKSLKKGTSTPGSDHDDVEDIGP